MKFVSRNSINIDFNRAIVNISIYTKIYDCNTYNVQSKLPVPVQKVYILILITKTELGNEYPRKLRVQQKNKMIYRHLFRPYYVKTRHEITSVVEQRQYYLVSAMCSRKSTGSVVVITLHFVDTNPVKKQREETGNVVEQVRRPGD